MLTREEIFQKKDIQTETVNIPQWGGDVLVRGLTGKERDDFEQSIIVTKGKKEQVDRSNARAKLCALSCVDEEGNLLFKSNDIEALGKKSAGALDKIYEVASRLSGLSDTDMDDLVGNSESDQSDNSTSD